MTVRISLDDPSQTYPGQKRFDCGNDAVNKFARDPLKAQVRKEVSALPTQPNRTAHESAIFVGFLIIAQSSVDVSLLAALKLGSLPKEIPSSRAIMLGVEVDYQKLQSRSAADEGGIPAFLNTVAKAIGSYGNFLDAEPGAIGFYQKLGFTLLQGDLTPQASPMSLPMSGIP